MTTQESFKRRVRDRMRTTGENYTAARAHLIAKADRGQTATDTWAVAPEVSDEAVRDATGRGWNEWARLLDQAVADDEVDDDHTTVAAHVRDQFDIDGWWTQTVTVGWERITGRRLPGQRSDGTFQVGRSRTMQVDGNDLRGALCDDRARAELIEGHDTTLRSDPSSKALRVGMPEGVAIFAIDERDDGRHRVAVQHEGLGTPDDVDTWRTYWGDWLERLASDGLPG